MLTLTKDEGETCHFFSELRMMKFPNMFTCRGDPVKKKNNACGDALAWSGLKQLHVCMSM